MKRIAKADWHAIVGHNTQAVARMHERDQVAIAFGGRRVYESTTLFAVDCVPPLIVDALAPVYKLDFAAQLVRVYADVMIAAIAHADHDLTRDYSVCIVDLVRTIDDAPSHAMYVARAGANPVDLDAYSEAAARSQGFEAVRTTCVNVSRLMRFARKTAAKRGVDLLDPFLPSPESKDFAELVKPFTDARENATAIVQLAGMRRVAARSAKVGAKMREHATLLQ